MDELDKFAQQFRHCGVALSAIGDETRQSILLALIENCGRGGLRVGAIRERTNLSRPAVSHHLKILREAGIITMRSEGTKNYYFIDAQSSSLKELSLFFGKLEPMMNLCRENNIRRKEN